MLPTHQSPIKATQPKLSNVVSVKAEENLMKSISLCPNMFGVNTDGASRFFMTEILLETEGQPEIVWRCKRNTPLN